MVLAVAGAEVVLHQPCLGCGLTPCEGVPEHCAPGSVNRDAQFVQLHCSGTAAVLTPVVAGSLCKELN